MGSDAIATCKCGYEETFGIGGGMQDFTTRCSFPCLCKRCKSIVTVNLLAKRPECPACRSTRVIPYDKEELVNRKGGRSVAEWNMEDQLGRRLELTNGSYYCPSCDSFDLTFAPSYVDWD